MANRLGHREASITLRVYAHVLRRDAADIGDVFATAASVLLAKLLARVAAGAVVHRHVSL